ncbi:MAG: MFS transporter [Actinomycetota bacterium]
MNKLFSSEHRHAPDGVILAIACIAQFMVVLDVSIVNVALPKMQSSLHMTAASAQWVVNAYVLTFAGFLLLGGRAADIFGRRHVYLTGLTVFVLASVGAGFAQSGSQIIAVRALQGIGGAILSPATLTIVLTTFSGPRLPKALGAWSAVAGAGGAFGGVIGGMLTGWVSWRWVFFINLPIGILAAVGAFLYLREMRNDGANIKLDVTGAVLVTGSLGAVIYGVVNTTTSSWTSTSTLSFVVAGVCGLAVFAWWESRMASHPLVPFRIFASRSLSLANLVMFLVGGAFFAMWFFLTYFFQEILGFGAVKAGFAFLPMALGIIVGAQISSRLMARTGARIIILVGAAMATGGFLWISRIQATSSYAGAALVPSVVCAFAMGLLFTPLASAATSGVDRADSGLASGLLNTGRQIGGSLSLAILCTVALDRKNYLEHTLGQGSWKVAAVSGYQEAFVISAIVTAVAFIVAWGIPRQTGKVAATSIAGGH